MSEIVRVATKAMRMMLGERDDPELILLSFPGSSGARVSLFRHTRTNSLYAVKCVAQSRVSLIDEIGRRDTLTPYLPDHLPQVLWCQVLDGFEVMISECKGIHSLHHLIINSNVPHSRLLEVWKDFIEALLRMWQSSEHQFNEALCPRFFPARLGRIKQGIRNATVGNIKLSECWDMPVVVNGSEYPSISKSFEAIAQVGEPKMGVVCHGDPQPSNIVVGTRYSWYCVDWEWAGPHQDWRMMLANLYGWWSSRCSVLSTEAVLRVSRNRLEIEHSSYVPTHLQLYQDIARSVASTMSAGSLSEGTTNDINRFLAALYFGEIRFLHMWGREAFAETMLAQAITTISGSYRGDNAQSFRFPQR